MNTSESFEKAAQHSYTREMKDIRNAARLRRAGQNVANWRRQERADNLADEICGEPLEVSVKRYAEILLGTGGPACGYTLYLDSDGEIESGFYWYQDWFKEKRQFWLDSQELEQVVQAYNLYFGE